MAHTTKLKDDKKKSPFEALYEWSALERSWKPRTRVWYLNWSLVFLVVIAIAARLDPTPYIFMLLVLAFAFMWFVAAAVKPDETTYSITPLGIKVFKKVYKWKRLSSFWYSKKGGTLFLNIDLKEQIHKNNRTRRISLIISQKDIDPIFTILIDKIDYASKEEVSVNIINYFIHGLYLDIKGKDAS